MSLLLLPIIWQRDVMHAQLVAPGSLLWLLQHDLLLAWRRFRSMFGGLRPRTALAILVVVFLVLHGLAWPAARWFSQTLPGGTQPSLMYPALAAGMMFILPWLISQSLTGTVRALYSRGDLDLLLASPLPARRILAARALSIAVEALASALVLIVPLINMIVYFCGPRWFMVYPVLAATALFAAAIGIALALALFAIAGPRRTRVLGQILATIIAAAFVLTLQVLNVVPAAVRDSIVASIDQPGGNIFLDRTGLLWLPVRALAGEGPSFLAWILSGPLLFAAMVWMLANFFVNSAVHSAAVAPASVRRNARASAGVRFRGGHARAMRIKEWRLLARDPYLLSQIMLLIVYTLPVSVVIWRNQGPGGSLAISVAPAIVVIASQVAASLAWLTISGEDAPEFLATAPVTRREMEWRKLQAIALPLLAMMALPVAGLAWFDPHSALLALVFAIGASACTAFLNFWHPMPGKRVMMLRHHSQSKLIAMMEHALALLWAVAVAMAALGSWLAVIPLSCAGLILWFNRPRNAAVRNAQAVAV